MCKGMQMPTPIETKEHVIMGDSDKKQKYICEKCKKEVVVFGTIDKKLKKQIKKKLCSSCLDK